MKAAVVKTTAMKASTMKTTASETPAVGLGSSNADQRGEGDSDDGCYHPQFAGHGKDPFIHIRDPISPSGDQYVCRHPTGLPCEKQIAELLEYGAASERLKPDEAASSSVWLVKTVSGRYATASTPSMRPSARPHRCLPMRYRPASIGVAIGGAPGRRTPIRQQAVIQDRPCACHRRKM
jgi:hypothetical protein